MKENWLYYIGLYACCIAVLTLILIASMFLIINVVLFICEMNTFGFTEFACSYILGFIILFILNLNVLLDYKENQGE